jgi:hypothetical protein
MSQTLQNQPFAKLKPVTKCTASYVKEIAKLKEALSWHIDDTPCRFDHNACCQEHGCFEVDGQCYMHDSKELLKELEEG